MPPYAGFSEGSGWEMNRQTQQNYTHPVSPVTRISHKQKISHSAARCEQISSSRVLCCLQGLQNLPSQPAAAANTFRHRMSALTKQQF